MHAKNLRTHMKTNAFNHLRFLIEGVEKLSLECQPLWHPLGFVSCLLKEEKGDHTLRVHYWPPHERRTKNPDWPIHTHSYTLSSLVINGRVQDIQYKTAVGQDYSIYEVRYFDGGSEIVKRETNVSIIEAVNLTQVSGNQYCVERGIFHQSRVALNESAVTLVALSEVGENPPLVLGNSAEYRYPYDRTPFDRATFWGEVKNALSSMGRS